MQLIKDPQSDDPYIRAGYKDRTAYLKQVAEDFDYTYKRVKFIADTLGAEEDFDALLTTLEDYTDWGK